MAIQCYSEERKNNVIYKWFLLRFIRILSSSERILIEVAFSHIPITPLDSLCRAQPPPPLKQNWGGGERSVVEKTADIWRETSGSVAKCWLYSQAKRSAHATSLENSTT